MYIGRRWTKDDKLTNARSSPIVRVSKFLGMRERITSNARFSRSISFWNLSSMLVRWQSAETGEGHNSNEGPFVWDAHPCPAYLHMTSKSRSFISMYSFESELF